MKSSATLFARLIGRARLRSLLLVVRIAELQSLQRAADAMAMTQPTATHALSDLEDLLESKLFDRHARGMRPTALCRQLLPHLRRAIGSLHECADHATSAAWGSSGSVRIGVIGAALSGVLPDVLPGFSERHPDVFVEVLFLSAEQMLGALDDNDIDVLLCRAPASCPAGLSFLPLAADRYTVVARPEHPLAKRRRITQAQLGQETWLQAPPRGITAQDFDQLCDALGLVPRFCWVSGKSAMTALMMLQARNLVAHLPRNFARQLLDNGLLTELDVPPAFRQAMPPIGALVSAATWRRGPGVAKLLDHLVEVYAVDPDTLAAMA